MELKHAANAAACPARFQEDTTTTCIHMKKSKNHISQMHLYVHTEHASAPTVTRWKLGERYSTDTIQQSCTDRRMPPLHVPSLQPSPSDSQWGRVGRGGEGERGRMLTPQLRRRTPKVSTRPLGPASVVTMRAQLSTQPRQLPDSHRTHN